MNRPLQILSLTVASLLFAACGDSTEKTPDSGGSPSNSNSSGQPESNQPTPASSPAGEWRLDVDKTIAENPGMVPEGVPEAAMVQMKQMMGSMTVTFSADGTAQMVLPSPAGNDVNKGTWSLEGNQIVLVTEDDEDDKPDSITFEDDTIVIRGEQNGQKNAMYFVRK